MSRTLPSGSESTRRSMVLRRTALLIACLGILFGGWRFVQFAGWWIACIAFLIYGSTVRARPGKMLLLALACAMAAVAILSSRNASPLSETVEVPSFAGLRLSQALQQLGQDRQGGPYWEFCIHGEEVAAREVHVDLPPNCTLRQALDALTHSADCRWRWASQSLCADELTAVSIIIEIWETGRSPRDADAECVWVASGRVWVESGGAREQ